MSTVLKLRKTVEGIVAFSQEATITLTLPYTHPAAKLFPAGKDVIFAKCKVQDGKVTIINPCKPWKEF